MNEIDVQNKILSAVRAQGGQGFKTNGKFLVGIPDLYINLPGYVPLLIEVKYRRGTLKPNFNEVVVGLSKMQAHILARLELINRFTAYSIVACNVAEEYRLYMLEGSCTKFSNDDSYIKLEKGMDIRTLFNLAKVRKLK